MKATQIRELTSEELQQKYDETSQELFNLRMQKSTGQIENPSRLRLLRREIARIRTVMNEKERAAP
jgi:large subunit ribosomal protein L29